MVHTFTDFLNSPRGGDLHTKKRVPGSYMQLFTMICMFSTIVLSYVIYVKSPHKLHCTV